MSRSVSKTKPKTISRRREGRPAKDLMNLQLGQATSKYPMTYSPAILESFPNRHPESEAWTSLLCPEFTSLCPKTGQPDFAHLTINYVAGRKMVESKSLKLYLFSFRNHGDFHEDCIQTICNDLVKLMSPKYLEVIGEFTPRGGIAIFPFVSYACNSPEYQKLKIERFLHYVPSRYTP